MALQYSDSVDLLTNNSPADSVGVTVDTTGTKWDISKRRQIVVQFVCSNHTSGNGIFTIDGSNDNGTTWTTGLALEDLTSTTPATRVLSATLNSNTSKGYSVPPGWQCIRAVVDVTTDGTYFAYLHNAG